MFGCISEDVVEIRLATATSFEPSFRIFVVSAFCVEHGQQETLASVEEAKLQKIATYERPNTVGNS